MSDSSNVILYNFEKQPTLVGNKSIVDSDVVYFHKAVDLSHADTRAIFEETKALYPIYLFTEDAKIRQNALDRIVALYATPIKLKAIMGEKSAYAYIEGQHCDKYIFIDEYKRDVVPDIAPTYLRQLTLLTNTYLNHEFLRTPMNNLVDTHIHLNDAKYADDLDEVIQTARDAGVKHIITNAIDEKTMHETLALAEKYEIVHAALGLYPDTIVELSEDKIEELLSFIELNATNIIAIGEIGLDYKYTTDDAMRAKQKKWFITQLKLATKLHLPVQIHTRDAESEVLDILDELGQQKVQLHCFAGGADLIKRAVKKGYYLSVPVKAIKNNLFQEIIVNAPMSRLLTETDGPYLHPVYGTRNDSSQVALTIEKIAELKKSNPLEVVQILFNNYKELYEM